jgi:sec-independent protein translocase protein TatA
VTPFAFFELSMWSIVLLLILGVILFGKQMPDVGKWLGKTVRSVKDGLQGVENEIEMPTRQPASLEAPRPPQRVTATSAAPTAPRFEDAGVTTPNVTTTPPPA